MNRKKMIKQGSAVALALTLALSAMILPQVRAATAIDMTKECSVSFELDTTGTGSFDELTDLAVPISLYQVATVNEYGEYTANAGFESLKLDAISSETTAAEWEQKAADAMAILGEDTAADYSTVIAEEETAASIHNVGNGYVPGSGRRSTVRVLHLQLYAVSAGSAE